MKTELEHIPYADDANTHWGWDGLNGHLVVNKPKIPFLARLHSVWLILTDRARAVRFHIDDTPTNHITKS